MEIETTKNKYLFIIANAIKIISSIFNFQYVQFSGAHFDCISHNKYTFYKSKGDNTNIHTFTKHSSNSTL